jgi:hypothetical protein
MNHTKAEGNYMASKIFNEHGVITIDNEVIARIAGQAAMECCGIVGMAAKNMKDGLVQQEVIFPCSYYRPLGHLSSRLG